MELRMSLVISLENLQRKKSNLFGFPFTIEDKTITWTHLVRSRLLSNDKTLWPDIYR